MVIVLVESPLQLLNAFEAVNFFNQKNVYYLVRLSGERQNDEQLIYLIRRLDICKVLIVTVPVKKISFLTLLKVAFLKILFILFRPLCKKLIIGNYDSRFIMALIGNGLYNKRKLLLVDDGAKTLVQQAAFNDDDNIDFFSMYELNAYKHQQVYRNRYLVLQEMFLHRKIQTCNETVLFLGSKLSEVGLISDSQYIAYLKQIHAHYKSEGLHVMYVPHRGENQFKLATIKLQFDFQITELSYPIELLGLYQDKLPKKVASFYSTALYSLNALYNIEVDCFEFDYSSCSNHSAIQAVYDLYRNHYHMIDLCHATKNI